MLPNWDHTPRSGKAGSVYVNATPENFYRMAHKIISEVNKKQNKLIILKSWNEWGEGNYMEPDLKYGHGYIEEFRKAITM
jgi:lipopolysaccharide biosynthesis protein